MDDKQLAIRSLARRGLLPIDPAREDAAIAESISDRNMRGNVSQQKHAIKSGKDLAELKARRRAKVAAA